MSKEYALYPFKVMRITQNYNQGNHIPHWKNVKNYSDKPWDEACEDGGRSYFEPQNDFIIEEVLGLNTSTTNSVRLKSVNKLYIPYKTNADYLYLTLTHMNEDNLKQVKKGDILKKGTKVLLEGTDGNASGNHFHITANIGKYYGLKLNNNGKWCYTYEKSLLPEEAFYVDKSFTTIKNSNGSTFIDKPSDSIGIPVDRDVTKNQVEIVVDNLNARNGSNIHSTKLGYIKKGIYNYISKTTSDGYTWYQIEEKIFVASEGTWCREYPKEATDIEKLQSEIESLQSKINELEKEKTLLEIDLNSSNSELKDFKEYIATKTANFYITLSENEKLIYKIVKD